MTRTIFAAPIAALVLIAAAPVPSAALASNASQAPSASDGKSGDAPAKADRKFCKTFYMSGSHARRERLCLTRAQWKEYNDAATED